MAEAAQQFDVARFDRHVIIGVRGVVDDETAPSLEREIEAALRRGVHEIVLDLNFCTSVSPLATDALRRVRELAVDQGATLRFTSVPRSIEPGLRASGLVSSTRR